MPDTELAREPGKGERAPRERAHPEPRDYVKIAVILAAVTLAEVAVYYLESVRDILIPLLFAFATVKFALVLLWFMHLKFDSRTYAKFFVAGLAAAVTLYIVVLLTFNVFAS